MKLATHVSFVDAPGHNMLMEVMLNGTCAMDYTMLVESVANPIIPAPQTVEHLLATEMMGTPNAVICMNKLDLVDKSVAITNISKLKKFLKHTSAMSSPLIPISATFDINIDTLCEIIANLPIPKRDIGGNLKMIVIRSFNINMPGTDISSIKGGVIGGSIINGMLKIGDTVTIYPGYKYKKKVMHNNSIWSYKPSECKVQSIYSDKTSLDEAIPGGLIGVQLDIDPSLTADDNMVGQIVIKSDSLKGSVYEAIAVNIDLIDELRRGEHINVDDHLVVNINANNIDGKVTNVESTLYKIELCKPVYIESDDRITISKKKKDNVYIIGIGKFVKGIESTQI
jgi:translation initiation factor 2 subunit 3